MLANQAWKLLMVLLVQEEGGWYEDITHYHINISELLAIRLALKVFLKDSNRKHVRILSDNITMVTYISNQGGRKLLSSNETTKLIWELSIHNNTHISEAHLPGKDNILADLASRKFHDFAEWMFESSIFDYPIDQFGRPEIYIFTSSLNKQIRAYASWLQDPESSFIDTFTINLNNMFIYVFPHFSIIWRVLQNIQEACKKAIIIVSVWATQLWFTRIMEFGMSPPIIIPSRYLILCGNKEKHPLYLKPQMLAIIISNQSLRHQMEKQLYQQY